MRKIICALTIAIFAVSCGSANKKDVVEQKLPMSVKTDAIPLKVDTINLKEEHIYVKKYFVKNDNVLVIVNKQNDSIEMLQTYSFPEQKPISSFVKFGKGPVEVVNAFLFTCSNAIIIHDYIQDKVMFVAVDSLLNTNIKPVFYTTGVSAQRINQYDKDRIIIENPYCFSDKDRGIINDAERFVIVDNNSKVNDVEKVFGKHKYYSYNVAGGEILVNKNKNSVIYASANFPFIEFFNYDLKLQKKYLSPDELKINYGVYNEGTANELVFKGAPPYMFNPSCSTDDYVYLCYNGDFLKDSEKNFDTWIFQFDWSGNFIKSYFCDRYISALSKSKDDGVFYATVMDDDNMPMFVKLYVQ